MCNKEFQVIIYTFAGNLGSQERLLDEKFKMDSAKRSSNKCKNQLQKNYS